MWRLLIVATYLAYNNVLALSDEVPYMVEREPIMPIGPFA
jgi:hypothetical protein